MHPNPSIAPLPKVICKLTRRQERIEARYERTKGTTLTGGEHAWLYAQHAIAEALKREAQEKDQDRQGKG